MGSRPASGCLLVVVLWKICVSVVRGCLAVSVWWMGGVVCLGVGFSSPEGLFGCLRKNSATCLFVCLSLWFPGGELVFEGLSAGYVRECVCYVFACVLSDE